MCLHLFIISCSRDQSKPLAIAGHSNYRYYGNESIWVDDALSCTGHGNPLAARIAILNCLIARLLLRCQPVGMPYGIIQRFYLLSHGIDFTYWYFDVPGGQKYKIPEGVLQNNSCLLIMKPVKGL